MHHLGVGNNGFFKLLVQAMDIGLVAIVGNNGLSDTFGTSRGIR